MSGKATRVPPMMFFPVKQWQEPNLILWDIVRDWCNLDCLQSAEKFSRWSLRIHQPKQKSRPEDSEVYKCKTVRNLKILFYNIYIYIIISYFWIYHILYITYTYTNLSFLGKKYPPKWTHQTSFKKKRPRCARASMASYLLWRTKEKATSVDARHAVVFVGHPGWNEPWTILSCQISYSPW